ncbi:type II toxin-antitoxin system RelE/ParE family toxin [Cerasicoccus frondis]|uniref:type II toxin-antitoxin system RelE/ParE family toxin n=1 Tax=Cerasicoccus frondis TaxID=490090 RepID=UPI0028527603|nr:type II toxin-antitoxin system RelE/ParE family toxin [Cerasicoccus frondis]
MKPITLTLAAVERLQQIWEYTDERWGEEQARRYLTGLHSSMEDIANSSRLGHIRQMQVKGRVVQFFRYQQHFVYFTEKENEVVILSILHGAMDIRKRLAEDLNKL